MEKADQQPIRTDERIVSVATKLFYEKGYHATTLREIATGCDIKAGSVYNHFSSKQELLMQIVWTTTKDMLDGAKERLEGVEGAEPRLRCFLKWHVEFHAHQRLAALVADEQLIALSEENRARVVALRDEHQLVLEGLLKDGREADGWAIEDLPVIAIAVATMCTQVDTWYREGGRLSPEQIGDLLANFTIAALRNGGLGK